MGPDDRKAGHPKGLTPSIEEPSPIAEDLLRRWRTIRPTRLWMAELPTRDVRAVVERLIWLEDLVERLAWELDKASRR
jgi:hypothetical protein